MTRVNIATLKEKLSQYLRQVEEGEEVIVTSYKQPVARIVPVLFPVERPREPSRPVSDLCQVKGIKRRRSASAVRELLEDRRGR